MLLVSYFQDCSDFCELWDQKSFDPDQIVLGLDFKNIQDQPMIFTHGWQNQSSVNLMEFLSTYSFFTNILATDISLDGSMQGPNLNAYQSIIENFPSINLIASGGISSFDELPRLAAMGCEGTIIVKIIIISLCGKISL